MTKLGIAAVMALGGCWSATSALAPPTENPNSILAPFVGSLFSQCTISESDSGKPGRSIEQREVQPSTLMVSVCPQYLVTTSTNNDQVSDPRTTDRFVYYFSHYSAPGTCSYANPSVPENSVACKLAQPAPWP